MQTRQTQESKQRQSQKDDEDRGYELDEESIDAKAANRNDRSTTGSSAIYRTCMMRTVSEEQMLQTRLRRK